MNNRLAKVLVYAAITGIVVLGMTACDVTGASKHRDVSYGIDQPVRTLVVQGGAGSIDVVGGGQAVTVTEHQDYQDAQPVSTHQVGADGTLTLAYQCLSCGIGYDIHVPAGTVVRLTERSGEVKLSGLTADVRASTGTGRIEATGLAEGKAELRVGTGSVSAAYTGAPGGVDATTGTGSIRISLPGGAGYAVSAGADTGSVDVRVPRDAAGRSITAHAGTGSVAVTGA